MSLADALARRLHRFASVRAVGKRLFRGRTIRQPFHGGLICLDAVEHSWAWTGAVRLESWDRPLQDRLLALSRECRSMIDVGGNVGVMTLSVALRNPTIRIVTVEPNARAAALLRQSVELNGLPGRVTVIEAVAADRDGEMAFEETGSATGHVAAAGSAALKRTVDFRRLVADTAAAGRCVIKVDVEGFETALIEGLPDEEVLRNVVLVLELHALGFNGLGDPEACLRMLFARHATARGLDGGTLDDLRNWTDPLSTIQVEARWS